MLLLQTGCAGSSSDGWQYSVAGNRATINNGVTGAISTGSDKVAWSNGTTYTREGTRQAFSFGGDGDDDDDGDAGITGFVGCYENEAGTHRLDEHAKDQSFSDCVQAAAAAGKLYFGLEFPQSSVAPGRAECVVLDALPHQSLRQDAECANETDSARNLLGNAFRLAVYTTQTGVQRAALASPTTPWPASVRGGSCSIPVPCKACPCSENVQCAGMTFSNHTPAPWRARSPWPGTVRLWEGRRDHLPLRVHERRGPGDVQRRCEVPQNKHRRPRLGERWGNGDQLTLPAGVQLRTAWTGGWPDDAGVEHPRCEPGRLRG